MFYEYAFFVIFHFCKSCCISEFPSFTEGYWLATAANFLNLFVTLALKVVRIPDHPMEGPHSGLEGPHFRLEGPQFLIAIRHAPCEGPHVRIARRHTPCEGPYFRLEGPHVRIASRHTLSGVLKSSDSGTNFLVPKVNLAPQDSFLEIYCY